MSAPNEWTVPWLVSSSARNHKQRTALHDPTSEVTLSYEQFWEKAEQRSGLLTSRFSPGDRLGVILESGYRLSEWLVATMWRHIAVPLSPGMAAEDLEEYLLLTRVKGVITSSENESVAVLARQLGRDVVYVEATQNEVLTTGDAPPYPEKSEIAALLMTSGTTSGPKIVPLSHENLTVGAMNVCDSLELEPGDQCLVLWAQHHIGGLVDLLLAPLHSGGTVVNGGTYSASTFEQLAFTVNPQWMQFVPTTLAESLKVLERTSVTKELSRLRFVRCVAAPLSDSLRIAAEEAFGCPIVHTYGLTEASPLVTSTRLNGPHDSNGSSGVACGTEVRVVGDKNEEQEVGSVGEIVIRGRNVFNGYEDSADRSDDFTQDGWFKTGDLGYLTSGGELFITGRKKLLVNRGGRNINPFDVERILLKHPEVTDAIALGRPHLRLGEALVAVVESGGELDSEELGEFLRKNATRDKIPDFITFVRKLPRNTTGKVVRRELEDLVENSFTTSALGQRSQLESEILRVWEAELDSTDFDVDTPFVMAGGDSLSMVRVSAELEQRFGLLLKGDGQLASLTINQIAQMIGAASTAPAFSISAQSLSSGSSTWLTNENVESFSHRIAGEASPTSRHLLQEAALTLLAPREIMQLAKELEGRNIRLRGDAPLRRWRAQPDPKEWVRQVVNPFSMVFHVGRNHTCGEVLVGFTGNQGRLLLPIHSILSALPSRFCRVLLVTDPHRDHYQQGIPGIAPDVRHLSKGLETTVPAEWLSSAAFLGTSAGAVAALICGLQRGSASIGLVGPDSPVKRAPLKTALQEVASKSEFAHVSIAVGRTPRDLQGFKDLETLLPSVSSKVFPQADHNVFLYTHRKKNLDEALNWLLRKRIPPGLRL